MFDNRAKGLIMTKADNDVVGDDVRKVAELAKDIRIGMLTTVDADGTFTSRPMGQQDVEFDGDLWYFAERDSRKVRQIAANPHVGVTLSSGSTWISIDGTAEIVEDPDTCLRVGISVWERYTGPYTDEMRPFVDQMMNNRIAVRVVPSRQRSWDHRKLGMPDMPISGSTAQYLGQQ